MPSKLRRSVTLAIGGGKTKYTPFYAWGYSVSEGRFIITTMRNGTKLQNCICISPCGVQRWKPKRFVVFFFLPRQSGNLGKTIGGLDNPDLHMYIHMYCRVHYIRSTLYVPAGNKLMTLPANRCFTTYVCTSTNKHLKLVAFGDAWAVHTYNTEYTEIICTMNKFNHEAFERYRTPTSDAS